MNTLDPQIPSSELNGLLNDAAALMPACGQRVLTPDLLLLAFLRTPRCAAARLIEQAAQQRPFSLPDLQRQVETLARTHIGRDARFTMAAADGRPISLSDEMLIVLDEGKTIAEATGDIAVGSEHALAAMCQAGVSTAGLLQQRGLTPSRLSEWLAARPAARSDMVVDWVALARQNQLPPLYSRAGLLRDLLSLLSLAGERHVILVGPDGAGKRSLAYSLAALIARGEGPVGIQSLVSVNEAAYYERTAAAIQAAWRKAAAQGPGSGILLVPGIHRFFGGIVHAELPDGAKLLQKAFLDGQAVIVGTTTAEHYQTRLSNLSAIAGHSRILRVPPTSEAETVEVLRAIAPACEREYGLTIAPESLPVAASLSKRYMTAAALPDSAVRLLHQSCAQVRLSNQNRSAQPAAADMQVDVQDITVAASMLTGIPVADMGVDERDRYARMVDYLRARIIGQDEAVLALSRAVKTARVGLKDPRRPIGSFMFLGPTGVGKTELAKVLAEFMFGSPDALLAIDMSEYMDESAVNRLIGAPPGYVGYEGGGQLTDRVIQSPYTIVLFDEVEKAHPRIFDLLLQVMEEGRLTDGKGRQASFSETVVLLTSNLGASFLGDASLGAEAHDLAMGEVKAHFRPEFLNRLDEIIFFNRLSEQDLARILDLILSKEVSLAAGRGLNLTLTQEAKRWLLEQNDHPEWGARPLRRIIQRHLREPLADYLLTQSPPAGVSLRVDAGSSALVFQVIPPR